MALSEKSFWQQCWNGVEYSVREESGRLLGSRPTAGRADDRYVGGVGGDKTEHTRAQL